MKFSLLAAALLLLASSVEAAPPLVSCIPSRTSGTAPLGVIVDCSGTTDADSAKPFHTLLYRHNFGDPGSGVWSNGVDTSASKNNATGPITAHVYETAGTYTITSQVSDGTSVARVTNTITVADPNTTFSGTNTICVAVAALPVAGSGGCPTGASAVQSSDWPTIVNTHAAAGKRVLLNRGETYTGTATAVLNNGTDNTGAIIGAYGAGAKPVIRTTDTTNNSVILSASGTADNVRLMDLDFDGQSDTHRDFFKAIGNNTLNRLLILRVDAHDLGGGIVISPGILTVSDQIFLVDSTIMRITNGSGTASGYGFSVSASQLAILGNAIDDNDGSATTEHLIRVNYANRGVISHNTLSNSNTAKEMMAIRAPCSDGTCSGGVYGTGDTAATKFVVVSGNKVETNSYAGVKPDTAGSASVGDAIVREILIEGNWFVPPSGGNLSVRVRANQVTVRNNVANYSLSTSASSAFEVDGTSTAGAGGTGSTDVWIYNNTTYSSAVIAAARIAILVDNNIAGLVIKNNILYIPNCSGTPAVVTDNGTGNAYTESNNHILKTSDPLFDGPLTTPSGFRIGTGSPAASGGTALWPSSNDDFFNCDDVTANEHIGAFISRVRARCHVGVR